MNEIKIRVFKASDSSFRHIEWVKESEFFTWLRNLEKSTKNEAIISTEHYEETGEIEVWIYDDCVE